MDLLRILSVAGSLLVLLFVVQLIRKGKLRERYALLWLVMGGVLLLFAAWRDLIDILADAFRVHYAPSFLFLVFLVILTMICLHLTVVVSRLSDRTRRLTQDLALLRAERDEGAAD